MFGADLAFYENKVEHFGGAFVLFQRNLAVAVPNSKSHRKQTWYMRLKISGRKGYITRSTKLTVYEDAYEFAKSELLRLSPSFLAASAFMAIFSVTTYRTQHPAYLEFSIIV